jgi:Putative lumazine-binding
VIVISALHPAEGGAMQRYLRILIPVFVLWSIGQAQKTSTADVDAIRKVAELYISAQPANLQTSFYPEANLYTTDDKGALRIIPFREYLERVRKNAGAAGNRHSTIGAIHHGGDAAVVEVVTTSPDLKVTDYLSLLRLEGNWKVVSKTFFVDHHAATAAEPTPGFPATASTCGAAEHHAFDFMIGTWQTSDPGQANEAPAEGVSTVEAMLDGCVVHEHRHLTRRGEVLFDGDAYWGYDITTRHPLLFYMDNTSHMQVYDGREENSRLAFYRERPDPDGTPVLIRITYKPVSSGYTQTVERSNDHGATWKPGGITRYLPKG